MRIARPVLVRLLPAIAIVALAVLPTPGAALTGDCGADYVACLNDRGGLDSSDRFHDTGCYGDYWACVASRILSF